MLYVVGNEIKRVYTGSDTARITKVRKKDGRVYKYFLDAQITDPWNVYIRIETYHLIIHERERASVHSKYLQTWLPYYMISW